MDTEREAAENMTHVTPVAPSKLGGIIYLGCECVCACVCVGGRGLLRSDRDGVLLLPSLSFLFSFKWSLAIIMMDYVYSTVVYPTVTC